MYNGFSLSQQISLLQHVNSAVCSCPLTSKSAWFPSYAPASLNDSRALSPLLCISFLSLQSRCPNSHSRRALQCFSRTKPPLFSPSLSTSAVFDSLSLCPSLLDEGWEIALPPFIYLFIGVCEKSGEQTEGKGPATFRQNDQLPTF